MATVKLLIDEFETNDFSIIAIHSILEDYRLAFFLNKELGIGLCQSDDKLLIKHKKEDYFLRKYVFDNSFNDLYWTLIQNKNEMVQVVSNNENNLFFDEVLELETKVFLLPEFKNVDYFLKIEHESADFDSQKAIESISKIHNISSVYELDIETIKSKNNLIF